MASFKEKFKLWTRGVRNQLTTIIVCVCMCAICIYHKLKSINLSHTHTRTTIKRGVVGFGQQKEEEEAEVLEEA